MANALGSFSQSYNRLVGEGEVALLPKVSEPSFRAKEEPVKSMLQTESSSYGDISLDNPQMYERRIDTRLIRVCLRDTELYSTRQDQCMHWWLSCWRGSCYGTSDSSWLNILIEEQLNYIEKYNDFELGEKKHEILVNIWRFSIFVYAFYHKHNFENPRDAMTQDFLTVESELQKMTERLVLIIGPDFLNGLDMRMIKYEDFRSLPGISPTDDYESIPKGLKEFFSNEGKHHLPQFVCHMYEQYRKNNSIQLLSNCLGFSENEINYLQYCEDQRRFPKVSPKKEQRNDLCEAAGYSGFSRPFGANTCFIGTGLQLLSLLKPELNDQLSTLIKTETCDSVRLLLSECQWLFSTAIECHENKEERYLRTIELMVKSQHSDGIKIFEQLPDLIDSDKGSLTELVDGEYHPYVFDFQQQDVVELINNFLTNVVKLDKSPELCIIRDCERIDSLTGEAKTDSGDWQFILDAPIPQDKVTSELLSIQEILDDMSKATLAIESSMDTERDILKADTTRLKYLFVQPKIQGSFEERKTVGEALRKSASEAIHLDFVDCKTGDPVEKFFELIGGIYYVELANIPNPLAPSRNFAVSNHYQFAVKTASGWVMYDDDKAMRHQIDALNLNSCNLPLGQNCLYLYRAISKEQYKEIPRDNMVLRDSSVDVVYSGGDMVEIPLDTDNTPLRSSFG